jgi:hypothetical protein
MNASQKLKLRYVINKLYPLGTMFFDGSNILGYHYEFSGTNEFLHMDYGREYLFKVNLDTANIIFTKEKIIFQIPYHTGGYHDHYLKFVKTLDVLEMSERVVEYE